RGSESSCGSGSTRTSRRRRSPAVSTSRRARRRASLLAHSRSSVALPELSSSAEAPTLALMEAAGAPQQDAAAKGKRSGSYSGRLLLRMPESLHGELAKAADRAGVSLNAYINDVLSGSVGKRRDAPAAPAAKKSRLTDRLLIVNLVVVAVVGVLAIVLI